MPSTDVEQRLTKLEGRLAKLEQQLTPPASDPQASDPPAPAGDRFWALEAVKSRAEGAGMVVFSGQATVPNGETYQWQHEAGVDSLLERDWTEFAETVAALAHPVRLTLVREILHGRRTVAELQALDKLGTTGQLYHHLRQLVSAGWLRTDGRGRYAVLVERVIPLLTILAASDAG